MAASVLTTKLFVPPPRPNLVLRPRLMQRLDEGLRPDRRLTLVSAPAGFGKTTLLSEWVANKRGTTGEEPQIADKTAWLSLDEDDNDPASFLAYLVAALRTTRADIGRGASSALQSPRPPPVQAVLISLINDIAPTAGRTVLILDDYHLIEAQPIHDALAFLLEHLPTQMHLVVATREDPHLPLARLRARGQLVELRAADLRFSTSEAAQFLNQAMGLGLSAEDVAVLEARTEGWVAGLQLAALSMQGRGNTASLIKSFTGSHRYVLDYLIEEVLEQQPERIQTFLLETAILDRLTGPLCDAVRFGDAGVPTDQDDGQAILERLDRANLFIFRLDEGRRWYRYHSLFADLLRQRLQQTHADQIPILHLRASEWYEKHGFTDEAIEHALRRGDLQAAADKIESHVDHNLRFGEHTRLRRWLDAIPEEVTFSKAHLCILHAGNLYIDGQVDEAERYLRAAELVLGFDSCAESETAALATDRLSAADIGKYKGRAAVIRSYLLSYRGDVAGSVQCARQALKCLPPSDATWRFSALDSIGTAYGSVDDALAYQARVEALEVSKATGNVYMVLLASLRLVVTLRDLGRLQQAIDTCQQQLALANENGLSQTALVGWLYTLWAEALAEKNELDSALQLADRGVALTERGNDVILLGSSYMCLLRVLFSRGDMSAATKIIREVQRSTPAQDFSPWILNQLAAWQARIWVAQGKLSSASQWADTSGIEIDEELAPVHDFDYVVLARLLIAQGRLDEASRLLQRLLEAADAGGRTSKTIEILALQALASQAAGDSSQAMAALERGLSLAEPQGFVRTFVDEGPPMARLLYEATIAGTTAEYARRLLSAFTVAEQEHADTLERQAPQTQLVEPLSARELEVLELIAEGLTNPEVASRLYLSLNTIKAHTRNIYGKLSVHSRTQAIARSRALGILPRA